MAYCNELLKLCNQVLKDLIYSKFVSYFWNDLPFLKASFKNGFLRNFYLHEHKAFMLITIKYGLFYIYFIFSFILILTLTVC